jgi:hypothetical protein
MGFPALTSSNTHQVHDEKLRQVPRRSVRSKPQQRLLREKNFAALYFHRDALLYTQSSSLRQFGGNVCPWRNRWCRGGRVGHRLCGRVQMTRAAKRTSVHAVPRQHASVERHDVKHASQAQGNVTRFPRSLEPGDSRADHVFMPVTQRATMAGLSNGLSETSIEGLLKRNDVVLLMECDQRVCHVPYRGKQRRSDVLRFLRIAGPQVRALVYSHQAEEGPVWIDVMSGEVSAR